MGRHDNMNSSVNQVESTMLVAIVAIYLKGAAQEVMSKEEKYED